MHRWSDEESATNQVLTELRNTARVPLPIAEPGPGPAVYLLGLAATPRPSLAMYAHLLNGQRPWYAGSAASASERLGRHITNIQGAEGLEVEDCWIAWLPTESISAALYGESLAIRALRPLLNMSAVSGFGSKYQGHLRGGGQRASRFDALHRRCWAGEPSAAERAAAMLFTVAHVAKPGSVEALWPVAQPWAPS